MTLLESFNRLAMAAERYAELSELCPGHPPAPKLGTVVIEQKKAEIALLEAAIEFKMEQMTFRYGAIRNKVTHPGEMMEPWSVNNDPIS